MEFEVIENREIMHPGRVGNLTGRIVRLRSADGDLFLEGGTDLESMTVGTKFGLTPVAQVPIAAAPAVSTTAKKGK